MRYRVAHRSAAARPGLTQVLALMKSMLLFVVISLAGCVSTDRMDTISESKPIKCLQKLIAKDNFAAIPGTLYTGVHDPLERTHLNNKFNASVQLLIAAANRGANENEFLAIIEEQINSFDRLQFDTEDAEQVGSNFELTLDCLEIKSSRGILNTWLYGFDPS